MYGWKPGLASKRIATSSPASPSPERPNKLETRTRFKEDCDTSSREEASTVFTLETRTRFKEDCDKTAGDDKYYLISDVGNQDSLQRGLRHVAPMHPKHHPWDLLETRTRFKEDCDCPSRAGDQLSSLPGWKPGLASKRIATGGARGDGTSSRSRWKPGLASKRIATDVSLTTCLYPLRVGNQDSLQRGLRRKNAPTRRPTGWKPGLASKRIATYRA